MFQLSKWQYANEINIFRRVSISVSVCMCVCVGTHFRQSAVAVAIAVWLCNCRYMLTGQHGGYATCAWGPRRKRQTTTKWQKSINELNRIESFAPSQWACVGQWVWPPWQAENINWILFFCAKFLMSAGQRQTHMNRKREKGWRGGD